MPPVTIETGPETGYKLPSSPDYARNLAEIKPIDGVIDVAAEPQDQDIIEQTQANLCASKVGAVALAEKVELKQKPIRNLKEGVSRAAEGDAKAEAMLDKNIIKEMSEYLYKAGNISIVHLDTDSQGRILQNGQLMQDVYRNGHQLASDHPILKERAGAEANNGSRIEYLNQEGYLDDHVFLVFSRTPDGISDDELDDLNFFSATKSLSIQATTQTEEGLNTETAFVAGVGEDEAERTDKEVVEAIYKHFGVDINGESAEDVIDRPLLIPKTYMKNGVIDIVKLHDDINGGTFYGLKVAGQDYIDHKKMCQQREQEFLPAVEDIRNSLVSANDQLPNAVKASRLLAKLVEERLVKWAVKDDSIDQRVFGHESAANIQTARKHEANGEWALAMQHAQTAIRTATGGSCPAALLNEDGLPNIPGLNNGNKSSDQERNKLSWHGYDDESKVKKGTCTSCKKKDVKVGVASWCKGCIKC